MQPRKTIFISYSHVDKPVVLEIERDLNFFNIADIVRDEKHLKLSSSIELFMKRIRECNYALLIVSDSFLKSPNCMTEILELFRDENLIEKIADKYSISEDTFANMMTCLNEAVINAIIHGNKLDPDKKIKTGALVGTTMNYIACSLRCKSSIVDRLKKARRSMETSAPPDTVPHVGRPCAGLS